MKTLIISMYLEKIQREIKFFYVWEHSRHI